MNTKGSAGGGAFLCDLLFFFSVLMWLIWFTFSCGLLWLQIPGMFAGQEMLLNLFKRMTLCFRDV